MLKKKWIFALRIDAGKVFVLRLCLKFKKKKMRVFGLARRMDAVRTSICIC